MTSPSLANASLQTSNYSMSSPSWPGTPQSANISLSSSWVYQPGNTPPRTLSRLPPLDEPITDEESLSKYLRKCEAYDKKAAAASPSKYRLISVLFHKHHVNFYGCIANML